MIKLKLTKQKISSLITIVSDTIEDLQLERAKIRHSLKRAEMMAHLSHLRKLHKKLRVKSVQVEDRFQDYKFDVSFDEMDAYLIVLYRSVKQFLPEESFHLLTFQQIQEPIFKHLLA